MGIEAIVKQVNEKVTESTQGEITQLLSVETDRTSLDCELHSWLYDRFTWQDQFKVMDSRETKDFRWDGKLQPEIEWMKTSDIAGHTVRHGVKNGFTWVEIYCTDEERRRGNDQKQVVFIMPPLSTQAKTTEDEGRFRDDSSTQTSGACLSDPDSQRALVDTLYDCFAETQNNFFAQDARQRAELVFPKFAFNSELKERSTKSASNSNIIVSHQAAFNLHEEGVSIAATSSASWIKGSPFDIDKIKFDRPFFCMMTKHRRDHDYDNAVQIVGMAYIHQPWRTTSGAAN